MIMMRGLLYYAEIAQEKAQQEAANKRTEDTKLQIRQHLLNTQIESAYRDAGGLDGDAFQAVKGLLNCEIQNDRILIRDSMGNIEKGANGEPKTLAEKLTELKQTSAGKACFRADSAAPLTADSKPQLAAGQYHYTHEQARADKAKIEDIASGKAVLLDDGKQPNQTNMEGYRQQTKVVNIDQLMKEMKKK